MRTLALATLAGCAQSDRSADPKPRDFALSLPVTAAPGSPVQRADLPAAALIALQRADHGDIRIYDAQHDRPLSLALFDPATTRQDQTHLDIMPITPGDRDTSAPMLVRVQHGDGMISIETGRAGQVENAAVLIDTRRIHDPVVAIVLDAGLPPGRPVSFSIAASADLTTWTPLAEQALFQPAGGAGPLGGGKIVLPAVVIEGQYLKITWPSAPATYVNGVTIFTTHTPPPQRVTVATTGLTLTDAHTAQFALPPAASPLALRVAMTGQDGVLPVHLSGRASTELPWTPLAFASLRQGGIGAVLETGDPAFRQFKLAADDRSAGFSQAPRLDLQFAPASLVVAFNGAAPYRLVVGDAAARPTFFASHDLVNDAATLPIASIAEGKERPVIDLDSTGRFSPFTSLAAGLWLVLLAGVGVLGLAAFKLVRANDLAGSEGT